MRARHWSTLGIVVAVLAAGVWMNDTRVTQADPVSNGEPHEDDAGGHAHVPAPIGYADAHVPITVWTDPKMIARGKEIYTAIGRAHV